MQDQNRTSRVLIGESFVGEGAEAAHVNTVLGGRDGPVGTAWATALATPKAVLSNVGHSEQTKITKIDAAALSLITNSVMRVRPSVSRVRGCTTTCSARAKSRSGSRRTRISLSSLSNCTRSHTTT